MATAIAFFILCLSLVQNGQVRFIFFPQIEGNNISAAVTMPEGTPFERTDKAVRKIAAAGAEVAEAVRDETGEVLFVAALLSIWISLWIGYHSYLRYPRGWGIAALSIYLAYLLTRLLLLFV